jgi:hypothetical protein
LREVFGSKKLALTNSLYGVSLGFSDCGLRALDEGAGFEAATKAGMLRKTKEISKYDRPIQDLENPEDEVQTWRGPKMSAER